MKRILLIAFVLLAPSIAFADPMDLPAAVKDAFSKAGLPVLREKRLPKDFTLNTVNATGGNRITLSGLKGKVVFLNFWATWCPPCRAEMPSMEILHQRFQNDGLVFLSVDIMESSEEVQKFLTKNKLTFTTTLDTNGSVSDDYNIQAIPTTYIIDRDGKIIISSVGGRNWNTPGMIAAFEALLRNGQ
ncbi:thioredoxin [Spirochaetia bacterium]|nr:thioredoxin [Spirochaetia bacterium]